MDVNYAYYTSAKGFRVVGGTAAQFLKADGSVDNNTYPTTNQADAKYLPFNGSPFNVNLNAKNISNVGSVDATVFRNGNSSVLVKSFALQNTTTVTSLGIKLTTPNSSNMMGSFTVTMFGYIGQTISFRVSMYKFANNWFGPSITWVHGDSSKISNIEFYKEDDSNLHIKVNFVTNFGTYNKTVITDVLANGASEVLHNPDLYTISVNPDNSLHTLQQTVANTQIVRDNLGDAPKNAIYLAASDLNTIVLPGFYYQLADANATLVRNYPTTTAGYLNVYKTVTNGFVQEYTTYGTRIAYKRSYTGSIWTAWAQVIDSANGGIISADITVSKNTGGNINIGTGATAGTNATPKFMNLNFLGYTDIVKAKISSSDIGGNSVLSPLIFHTYAQTGLQESMRIHGNGNIDFIGNLNSTTGELILQRNSVTRFRTSGTDTVISSEGTNIYLRPKGDSSSVNQIIFNNNTSQYTDSHNILLGTQTSVGSSVFHTAVANLLSGYGIWMGHNLQWDGTNFIQPRGNLHSWGFTANNHKGFSFNFGLSAGTNGGIVNLNEILKIDSTGQITTANNGNSTQWSTAFGWGNHALAGYATTAQIGTQIASSAFPRQFTTTNVIDLNTLTLEGVYYGYQWLNQPTQASAIASLTVKRYSNDWIRQEYNFMDGSGLTYVRDRYSGTTWGTWKIIANRDWVTSQLGSYVTQSSLNTQLAGYATLAGVQTFSNTITFGQSPIVPTGTLGTHAVNLNQLNASVPSSAQINNWNNKVDRLDNVTGVGFDGGTANTPYVKHSNGTNIRVATETWTANSFAALNGDQEFTGINSFMQSPAVPFATHPDDAVPFGQAEEIAQVRINDTFAEVIYKNSANDLTFDFHDYPNVRLATITCKGSNFQNIRIENMPRGATLKIMNGSASLSPIIYFDGGSNATGLGNATWAEFYRDQDSDIFKNNVNGTTII